MKRLPVPAIDVRKEKLKDCGERIREIARDYAESVVEIGEHLVEAKALCRHGEWLIWLTDELGWKERTAREYMAVYHQFKTAKFADLSIDVSALFLLARSQTPVEVREEALLRAQSQRVTHQRVAEMIKAAPKVYKEAKARPRNLEQEAENARAYRVRHSSGMLDHALRECITSEKWVFGDYPSIEQFAQDIESDDGRDRLIQQVAKCCEALGGFTAKMRALRVRLEGTGNAKVRSIGA